MKGINGILSNKYTGYIAALLSGILFFLSDFPNPIAWLSWIAPVPVLAVAIRRGFPSTFILGLIYAIFSNLGSGFLNLPYFIPIFARIGIYLFHLTLFSCIFYLTVYLIRHVGVIYSPWIYASVVTAISSVQELPYLGHMLPQAYIQFYLPQIRSIASLGGDYLIIFSLHLFSGILAMLILDRSKKYLISSGTALSIIIAFLVWGDIRLRSDREAQRLKVAAIAVNYPEDIAGRVWYENIDKVQSDDTWYLFSKYEEFSRQAANKGALIIAWPEYGLWVLREDIESFEKRVMALARKTGSVIAAGFIDIEQRKNNVLLAGPDGEKEIYTKHHLVFGGESIWQKVGEKPYNIAKIKRLGISIATRICYDHDYPQENREAAQNGADVFLAPSSDAISMAEMHAVQHALRATENGIPLIRPTLTGNTIIADFDGSIVAVSKKYEPGTVNMIMGDITLNGKSTPYRKGGNWIVYISFIIAGLMIVMSRFRKNPHFA